MIQGGEIVIILVLALIVLGPKRLPEVARKLGGWTAELRAAARDIRQGLEAEVADLKDLGDEVRSIGQEVKKPVDELKQPLDDLKEGIQSVGTSRLDWTGPKPVSGPTPEDAMRDLDQIEKVDEVDKGTEGDKKA
jgi:Tat protein translocase TatB subunit